MRPLLPAGCRLFLRHLHTRGLGVSGAAHRRCVCQPSKLRGAVGVSQPETRFLSSSVVRGDHKDPRLKGLGPEISDDYAHIRDSYDAPKHPIVLAHGLLGFAELRLLNHYLPPIHYWRGITDALKAKGIEVITASVPPSDSIQDRAARLSEFIAEHAAGKSVNIIAHSMGGLDARYMISRLRPENVRVKSLVTVASPHHGSAFADRLIEEIGPDNLARIYGIWRRTTGLGTEAFEQLTRTYMNNTFNPDTPDLPDVRYFSYGAMMQELPPLLSPFRLSHGIIQGIEGPNDGLVSVSSSMWGTYKGTLVDVSHMDLINWTNRLRWTIRRWMGRERT